MAALRSAEGPRRKQWPQVGCRYLKSLICCQGREGLSQSGVSLGKRQFYEKAGGVPGTSQGSIVVREKVCDLVASLPSEASRHFCLQHDLEKNKLSPEYFLSNAL